MITTLKTIRHRTHKFNAIPIKNSMVFFQKYKKYIPKTFMEPIKDPEIDKKKSLERRTKQETSHFNFKLY